METRLAGVKALEEICSGVPVWDYPTDPDEMQVEEQSIVRLSTFSLDVQRILEEHKAHIVKDDVSTPDIVKQEQYDNAAFLKNLAIPEGIVADLQEDEAGPSSDGLAEGQQISSPTRPAKRTRLSGSTTREPTPLSTKKVSKPKARLTTPSSNALESPSAKVSIDRSQTSTPNLSLQHQPELNNSTPLTDENILAGLSSRQAILLKRKMRGGMSKEDAMAESLRLQGTSTPNAETVEDPISRVASPNTTLQKSKSSRSDTPNSSTGPALNKKGKKRTAGSAGIVKEEPDVKPVVKKEKTESLDSPARDTASSPALASGGVVEASRPMNSLDELLPSSLSEWVWSKLLSRLLKMLESDQWEARHGGSLAIRDLLRTQGKICNLSTTETLDVPGGSGISILHQESLKLVTSKLMVLLVTDRFGDFVGDTVMAPVREAASQALAGTCRWMCTSLIKQVGNALLDMIVQSDSLGTNGNPPSKGEVAYVWELRHAGLLGLRYMLAVKSGDMDATNSQGDPFLDLHQILSATLIGLSDSDDDVRSVSATCLLPILSILVKQLSTTDLLNLLDTLWNCFASDGDDLGSSTSAVMDLLCRVLGFPNVLQLYSETDNPERQLSRLIPRLYPFFRHTIGQVRLSVVKTIQTFLDYSDLASSWTNADLMHLLFKNLIVEERLDIRSTTLSAWNSALHIIHSRPQLLEKEILPNLAGWMNIALVPLEMPLDTHLFHKVIPASSNMGHDVDKSILSADLGLVSVDTILRNRIDAIVALAEVTRYDPSAVSGRRSRLDEMILTCYFLAGYAPNTTQGLSELNKCPSTLSLRYSRGRMDKCQGPRVYSRSHKELASSAARRGFHYQITRELC